MNSEHKIITETASFPVITGGLPANNEIDINIVYTAANANAQWRSFSDQPLLTPVVNWIQRYGGKRLYRFDIFLKLWTVEDGGGIRQSCDPQSVFAILYNGFGGFPAVAVNGVDYGGRVIIPNPALIDWGFSAVMGFTSLPVAVAPALTAGLMTVNLTYSDL